MQLPFTATEFLDVFAQYNQAVWPAQFALAGIGVALAILDYLGAPRTPRWIGIGLAVLWGWMVWSTTSGSSAE